MSKVAKRVLGGVSKIASKLNKLQKKVRKSKLGRIIAIAAAVYFGGPAIMGAFGGGAAATAGAGGTALTGLSGAAANIGAAWTSLQTAGSSLLAGNFGNAFSALGQGAMGNAATMGAEGLMINGAMPAATQTLGGATMGNGLPVGVDPSSTAVTNYLQNQPGLINNAIKPANNGFFDKLMASQYGPGALVMGGTQLIGGAMQGIGAQQQQKQQIQLADDERKRYNTNVGTRLWG